MSGWTPQSRQRQKKKNLPEQLKRSEDHDKIKGLHVEGKSDQTHEGKDCHRKVKPGHVVRREHGSRTRNSHLTRSPSHYSQVPARAEISHRPQPRNLQQHLYAVNWMEEDKKLPLSSSLRRWQFVRERNMEGKTLTCQKNNVIPGNDFGPRKSVCKADTKEMICSAKYFPTASVFKDGARSHCWACTSPRGSTPRWWPPPHLEQMKEDIYLSISADGSEKVQPRFLHMVYWKALDFTSRWTPRRRKRSRGNVKHIRVSFSQNGSSQVESSPLKMRKVVWGRSSNQCSPLRRAWDTHTHTNLIHKKGSNWTTNDKSKATYLPFKTSDLIKLIKVLQTVAGKKHIKLIHHFKWYVGLFKGSPEHRRSWRVQSFIREEAVSGRHTWSVKSHQTVKLFQRHAHRSLKDDISAIKQRAAKGKDAWNEVAHDIQSSDVPPGG